MTQRKQGFSPVAGIIGLLFVAMMIWIAVSAVKGVFTILSWLALPLFVIALVLNYRVVIDYFQWIWRTIREDTPKGLLYALGSALGYPLVSAYLAFKAYTTKKVGSKGRDKAGEYIKYKEVEEDDFLELPDLDDVKQKQAQPRSDNTYDDVF